MTKFTVEEINMARSCVAKERKEMVQELVWLLHHCDGYMKELVSNTINKLEHTSDNEFAELLEYPAEIFEDEEEQTYGE